ncbi:MAG: hypothetical protein ABR589_05375 [Chthoniobacterales bacterium]
MNKLSSLLTAIALITTPCVSFADNWTSVCSAGATIDETSANKYLVRNAGLGHRPGATGPFTARYNVTNTAVPGNATPDWNVFEFGYLDKSPASSVSAALFEVKPCTGAIKEICRVLSKDLPEPQCRRCFLEAELDFSKKLYYVQVSVSRGNAGVSPRALTLRLYRQDPE